MPSTHEIATAAVAGLDWGMLLTNLAEPLIASGELIALGGKEVTTPLNWHVAVMPSALLDALTEAVLATARRELQQG